MPNEKLRQERLRRQWTHAKLAELLDISDPRTISRWERGIANPSPLSRQKLCEVFGKSEEELGLIKRYPDASQGEPSVEDVHADTGIEAQQPLSDSPDPSGTETTGDKNRQRLIARVQAFWIKSLLEESLHGAALIALGLKTQAKAVANPWRLVLQLPDQLKRPLPPGTRITQVYDDAANELLILGQPGSGKTTLLLELASDLIERARLDESHPIPVIFNLSSWGVKRQPLVDWLIEELNSKYQVPRKLGQRWVDEDQVLLLLDGLDEVSEGYRETCIRAINAFHQEHSLVPLVVCSRSEEYLSQTVRVALNSAVGVQPLTAQQIEAYLASTGQQLMGLQAALRNDLTLQELATTPLMLSILALTYQGKSLEEIQGEGSATSRRQVFENYTQRMLYRDTASMRYTPRQTIRWLAWLAQQMRQHDQTVFYLERLQPDWLPEQQLQRHYQRLVKWLLCSLFGILIGGINGGLIAGLIIGHHAGQIGTEATAILAIGIPLGIMAGLLVGLIMIRFYKHDVSIHPSESITWSWSKAWQDLLEALVIGAIGGTILWRIGAWITNGVRPFSDLVVFWLVYQIGGILIGGIVGALIASGKPRWFRTNQHGSTLSQQEKWHLIRKGLLIGLGVSLMDAVLDGRIGNAESNFFYQSVYQLSGEPIGRLTSG